MKNLLLILVCITITIGFLALIETDSQATCQPVMRPPDLKLMLGSSSQSYILGQTVQLHAEITNVGDVENKSTESFVGKYGYLHVYVAGDDGMFKEYFGPGPQVESSDLIKLMLKSGESYGTDEFLLWNGKPDRIALGNNYEESGRILTDYAFPKAGVYAIKAVVTSGPSLAIKSEQIQIIINEPLGDDLKIWNRIRTESDFGYFMQLGYFQTSDRAKKEKLVNMAEEFTIKYPGSVLAGQVKQSLEQYREGLRRIEKARLRDGNARESKP